MKNIKIKNVKGFRPSQTVFFDSTYYTTAALNNIFLTLSDNHYDESEELFSIDNSNIIDFDCVCNNDLKLICCLIKDSQTISLKIFLDESEETISICEVGDFEEGTLNIIEHKNFYAIYINVANTIYCYSCIVNYSDVETQSINVSFNYDIEPMKSGETYTNLVVAKLNDEMDLLVYKDTKESESSFDCIKSYEINSLGEMDFIDTNLSFVANDSKSITLTNVCENVCALGITLENESSGFKDEITLLMNTTSSEYTLQTKTTMSPIMGEYEAVIMENLDLNHQFLKLIGIGNKSFAAFYSVKDEEKNYLRCAIGTVNEFVDENGTKEFDVYWQEVKDKICEFEISEYEIIPITSIDKSTDNYGNEYISFGYCKGEEFKFYDFKFSPTNVDYIGIAGMKNNDKRAIYYSGEITIDNNDIPTLSIGKNLYCDDFGNLTTVTTENYIGQYIGNNKIVKK